MGRLAISTAMTLALVVSGPTPAAGPITTILIRWSSSSFCKLTAPSSGLA